MNHTQISIQVTDPAMTEVMIALLADIGFEGFEESDTVLNAYIAAADFPENDFNQIVNQYSLIYSKSIINKQNWNAVWESNFEPIRVDDFVGIRASFHPPITDTIHEIVITPKMSFGTGHHPTTYLVMQLMRELDFAGKSVFDFGTGTGILAILAEKLGANEVLAVDYDDWCIENASENISINRCQFIDIQKNSIAITKKPYAVVIANINKNIILDNLSYLAQSLVAGGDIILSGLLLEDADEIIKACHSLGWTHILTTERGGWIAIRLQG